MSRISVVILIVMLLISSLSQITNMNNQIYYENNNLLDTLANLALKNITDPRDKYYLKWLSGRDLIINASQVPILIGRNINSFCVLAYYQNSWHPVTIIPFHDMIKLNTRIILTLDKTITPSTKLLLSLPTLTPSYMNPLKRTPAPARGAKEWGWINISSNGYTYPLLVVFKGPQIDTMCGFIPGLKYDQVRIINNQIIANDPPYLLRFAIKQGYTPTAELLETLHKLPRDVTVSVSPLFNHPLPDGGGGGGNDYDFAIWTYSPMILDKGENGTTLWKEINIHIDDEQCNNGQVYSFNLYPLSPSVGMNLYQVQIKSIIITIYGDPIPDNDNSPEFPILNGEINIQSEHYQGTGFFDLIGLILDEDRAIGDYYTLVFNISEDNPYGIHDTVLDVNISGVCTSGADWNLTFTVSYIYKIYNISGYFTKKIIYNGTYGLLLQRGSYPNNPLTILVVPAGKRTSDPSFSLIPIGTPGDIAILARKSLRYSVIPLKIKIPPRFPGGFITFTNLPGIYNFVVGLPSNPSNKWKIYTTNINLYTSSNISEKLLFLSNRIVVSGAKLILSQTANKTYIVKVYIDEYNLSKYKPFIIKQLPVLPLKHDLASYPNVTIHRVLLPIANYNYVLNNDYKLKSILYKRIELNYNFYQRGYGNYYIYGLLSATASFSTDNIYMTLSLIPKDYELNYNTNLRGAGEIREFRISLTVNYLDQDAECNDYGHVIEGITSEGGLPEFLEKIIHIIRPIISFLSHVKKGLSYLGTALTAADIILKTKSIVDVNVNMWCDGNIQHIIVYGDNTGWAPDDFQNIITFMFPMAFSPGGETGCAVVSLDDVHIYSSNGLVADIPKPSYQSVACNDYTG